MFFYIQDQKNYLFMKMNITDELEWPSLTYFSVNIFCWLKYIKIYKIREKFIKNDEIYNIFSFLIKF